MADAETKVKEYEQQYMDGLITKGEKYNKVVDICHAVPMKLLMMMKGISNLSTGMPNGL